MLLPDLEINLKGLKPKVYYTIQLRFVNSDNKFYNYSQKTKQWMEYDYGVPVEHDRITTHPDSPKTGMLWMTKPVNFRYLTLTLNPKSNNDNVSEVILFTHYFTQDFAIDCTSYFTQISSGSYRGCRV